jgi:hypothetical protein
MKTSSNLKTTKLSLHAILALACLAVPVIAHAISPPPDGGYPGGNTAEGQNALFSLSSGGYNTGVGFLSLRSDTTNSFNTAVGAGALLANSADQNTATGAGALLSNNTGTGNTATGAFALFANTTGAYNNAFGSQALYNNITGRSNTAIGDAAAYFITGTYNICIGANVYGSSGEDNTIRIGDNLPTGAGQSACYIGGIFGQSVDPGSATTVYAGSNGKLGIFLSSQRFKRDIEPMSRASEAVLALKPVTFHYKSDAKNTPCFGLIAEQVAQVDPDLVVRDKEGKPYSVRYDQVNAMLLNEFLKEHRKVEQQDRKLQKQETTIAQLKSEIKVLTAGLKVQAAEIQKVSAQLELSKPATKAVLNNQ